MLWVFKAWRYQFLGQCRRPWHFAFTLLCAILNNAFFIYGMCGGNPLAFQRHSDGGGDMLRLQAFCITLLAWGIVQCLFGAWLELGHMIDTGQFESLMATPRHPLWISALQNPGIIMSIAELIAGCWVYGYLSVQVSWLVSLKVLLAALNVGIVFAALLILAAALNFFIADCMNIAQVLMRCTLLLALFFPPQLLPSERHKWVRYWSPLLLIQTLPMGWIQEGSGWRWLLSLSCAIGLLTLAIICFGYGMSHYQPSNRFQATR